MHVHALGSHWDCASGCCHMVVDQIFVKPTMANAAIFLFICVCWCEFVFIVRVFVLTMCWPFLCSFGALFVKRTRRGVKTICKSHM